MTAYINYLNNQKLKQMPAVEVPKSLGDRFDAWFNSLPSVAKSRAFAMSEFEVALKTQGKYMGIILNQRGWIRKRKYTADGGQFNRYWLPPKDSNSSKF